MALAIVVWIGAVVYPDPRPFAVSMARLRNPPIDAQAAQDVAAQLPFGYVAIDDFVHEWVRWEPAWTVYGLPWYFPTVEEALRDRAGDCQAQAVVMASILEAKGMPYSLHYSFDHVWVDYPGKNASDLEDVATSFMSDSGKGWLAGLPSRIPVGTIAKQRVAYHWTPMPLVQKLLIVLGTVVIVGWGERRFFRRTWRKILPPVSAAGAVAQEPPLHGRPRDR